MMIVLRLAAVYATLVLAGLVIYVVLFQFGAQGIVFYHGLWLAVCAATIQLTVVIIFRQRIGITLETAIATTALSLAFNLCMLTVFIVTIDRSISVYLLSRLDTQPMTTEMLRDRFIREYVGSMDQINRRVEEQQVSGNLLIDRAGVIHLTAQGHRFLEDARLGTRLFGTDTRFTAAGPRPVRAP
jgi:hypothetical protein